MLRSLAAAGAVCAVALIAVPAQAGTSGARLADPAGDIPVSSLDVVTGAITLDAHRTLTMTASMTGDLTGLPADYDLVTGTRVGSTCYTLATRLRWNGVSLAQSYQHTSTVTCSNDVTPTLLTQLAQESAQYAVGGDPVDATAGGRTVTVHLTAPSWLRRGSLAGFGVVTHTPVEGVSSDLGAATVGNYDLAGIDHDWRVG